MPDTYSMAAYTLGHLCSVYTPGAVMNVYSLHTVKKKNFFKD